MIEFESVGKTFRDGTAAVQDLSLTIPSDKITVVVGPSGCGKTTTLRMVNRMLEPSTGKITWDGTSLKSRRKTTLRRQMGYVIQSGGLFPHRSVLENIGTVPGLLGWDKTKTRKRSLELLESVGLDRKMADRYPAQLSGGQQQRVGVARALAADPLVMLMDEPFSAVDPVVRGELHEFFLGLQREISKTIILITHDIDEAIKLGDQVVILRVGGRLAQVGTPQQLLDEPADAFVEGFVGRDRGYRSLSFLPADRLDLDVDRVKVVREAGAGHGESPTLVVDADARPIGWADASRPGKLHAIGSTFSPEGDTLRAALDSALTSPYGLAVAIAADTGRYAGVVSAEAILAQVSTARSEVAETLAVRASGPATEESGADHTTDQAADEAADHTTDEDPDRTTDEGSAHTWSTAAGGAEQSWATAVGLDSFGGSEHPSPSAEGEPHDDEDLPHEVRADETAAAQAPRDRSEEEGSHEEAATADDGPGTASVDEVDQPTMIRDEPIYVDPGAPAGDHGTGPVAHGSSAPVEDEPGTGAPR